MKRFLSVLAAAAIAVPAAVHAGSPREALDSANSQIKQAVSKPAPKGSPAEKRMKDEVKKVVTEFLDYAELARRSMGKYWADRTDKERTEFTGILKDLIEASYLNKISGNADYQVEFLEENNEDAEDGDVLINTKISAKAGSVNVGYKMHQAGGKWVCFDLLIDDVSTLRNYKAEFNKIIKDQGYPALVNKMKDKLSEIKKDGASGKPESLDTKPAGQKQKKKPAGN
jgi:phospholipid transport system substrate-binding protein